MGASNYSDEFKRDAVSQIAERDYPVRETSGDAKIRHLKRELARLKQERDLLEDRFGSRPVCVGVETA